MSVLILGTFLITTTAGSNKNNNSSTDHAAQAIIDLTLDIRIVGHEGQAEFQGRSGGLRTCCQQSHQDIQETQITEIWVLFVLLLSGHRENHGQITAQNKHYNRKEIKGPLICMPNVFYMHELKRIFIQVYTYFCALNVQFVGSFVVGRR